MARPPPPNLSPASPPTAPRARGLFPLHRTGVSVAPVERRGRAISRRPDTGRTRYRDLPDRQRPWRDLVQHPPLPDAPRRFPARPDRCAACHGPGPGAREPQRQRLRHRAQCHEAERPHSRADRPSRGIRRVVLLAQRLRHASRGPAVGLADRRSPSDHQLLRAGRPDRVDAAVPRLGAGARDVRPICRHPRLRGGGSQRLRPDARVVARAAGGSHRQPGPADGGVLRRLPRQPDVELPRHPLRPPDPGAAVAIARPDQRLCRPHPPRPCRRSSWTR